MSERSKRDKQLRLEKLAELKRARAGGPRVVKNLEEEDVQIYDEVTEEQYRSIVKGRLQKDDFVVDDGVGGYMDNGMDDWLDGQRNESESEEEDYSRKKKTKRNGKHEAKAKPKPRPPPAAASSMSVYRPAISAEKEDELMSSILGSMDSAPPELSAAVKSSRKRKPSPEYDYSDPPSPAHKTYPRHRRTPEVDSSSDGYLDDGLPVLSSDDYFPSPNKRAKTASSGAATPATEMLAKLEVDSDAADVSFDDMDMDAFMDLDDVIDVKPVTKPVPAELDLKTSNKASSAKGGSSGGNTIPSWLSIYDSLSVADADTLGPLATTSGSKSSNANVSALEPDGSLRFFWIDYLEHEGKLYFIGKIKDKVTNAWLSCCVTVENLQRNLFVLPREKRVEQNEDSEIYDTDIVPSPQDVHADFDMIRKQLGIKAWKGKFVKRKYAFGVKDVPRQESQWLKVVYGFNEPVIPATACSPNIAYIFGTNTSAFELLVVKRKIMGPCWLQIKKPQIDNKGVSWCKLEVTVSDPKDISPFAEADADTPKETPPLTIVSLAVRTIVNHKENNREVVCATARIWHNMVIDDPTPPERLPCTVHTFVRPLDRFPPNFEVRAKTNGKGVITSMKNERMLLSNLLMTLYKADPDVIVGHEFLGVSLDVLLHRMRDLKVDHWSRLGRFRRSKWPNIGKQGTNLRFMSGRMLCDLASDGAKSMISSTTWSLTEMCSTHLKSERQEIDLDDTASYFDGNLSHPDRLLTFVRHCELDAHYQMAIAAKVQILPLTKQLTNLAGNSWNKTLNGGRAERNEYILLHEFHRLKYVCPDKVWGKKSPARLEAQEDEGNSPKTTKGRRDKYKGGLVFEPKRGLWDKFILVMDFNSLYPSIIQEYNIDFTTVDTAADDGDDDNIPEPPPPKVDLGILPRLISTLVNRRRAVKSLMKDKGISHAKLLQYDIKQQALKLTANSMYGCLGFEHSRFYAKPLAALTTFKGREILTRTRELAESLELDVVYGDTDSVFVNTNATELSEALKISAEFKRAVNNQYKLLEIDLDAVFQRLLLLQKKKYAALKVEDGSRTSTEVKGLDMKRREYCALSKNTSQYVLEQILSGEATESVVANIHEYLTTLAGNIRAGRISTEDFTIYKRLGKNPEDYPDAKSHPQVQVALRMKTKGGSARSGDVIPYIFCVGEGEEGTKLTQAERARHPDEIRKGGLALKIDFDYYLVHQILPPIERLCEPIEGTDRARLAECLGLDPTRYRSAPTGVDAPGFSSLDSQMSDAERFRDALPFVVHCGKCKGELPFAPLRDRQASIISQTGPSCPSCQAPMSAGSLQMQLESQIRSFISKYYEGWLICEEPGCRRKTRMMGLSGRRCLRPDCSGNVVYEYNDIQLYNQLRYFVSLFDGQKAINSLQAGVERETITAVVGYNAGLLQALSACVDKYLDLCGRRWVDLNKIFSFMNI